MKIKRILAALLLLVFVAIMASSCSKKTCPAYSNIYRSIAIVK